MAKIQKDVIICDVCGKDTRGFHYWESLSSPYGQLSECTLAADVCKKCMDVIRYNIPAEMKIEKHDNEAPPANLDEIIDKWREMVFEHENQPTFKW